MNWMGQLGSGMDNLPSSPAPVVVQGLNDIDAIYAGLAHTCVRTKAGIAYCWGYNRSGQVGDGTVVYPNAPVRVSLLGNDVTTLGLGGEHTCASTGASVFCWGDNESGQVGDGTTTDRWTPVFVVGFGGN